MVQLRAPAQLDGLTGLATVTVWQTLDNRERLATQLALRSLILIGVLIVTVAAVGWFGVATGLRPLTDLQRAVSQRSSNALRPITRPLPEELSGLVGTLHTLFGRVQDSMRSKDVFISNAAHQLRNPVAGILSLAQSLQSAPVETDRNARAADLVTAARNASRLTTQLLSYERAQAAEDAETRLDAVALVRRVVDSAAPGVLRRGLELSFDAEVESAHIEADEVLFAEAIDNLIDNAVQHGGPKLTKVQVSVACNGPEASIAVCDDGKGIAEKDRSRALSRFVQIGPSKGSGLGLPSCASVVRAARGRIELADAGPGLCVRLYLPRLAV